MVNGVSNDQRDYICRKCNRLKYFYDQSHIILVAILFVMLISWLCSWHESLFKV